MSHWRFNLAVMVARPRLLIAGGVAVAVDTALLLGVHMRLSTALILGWDAFCLVFLTLEGAMVAGEDPKAIAARAVKQDEGQHFILVLTIGASAASLAAVAAELSLLEDATGLIQALHAGLAVSAVAGSWLVVQVILALHYAHEYYARGPGGKPAGGLAFPGGEAPDYWDFLHFAVVIGVASQTADIAITDRRMRRLGTIHSLIAFVFNTLIIALTINLIAGLFG